MVVKGGVRDSLFKIRISWSYSNVAKHSAIVLPKRQLSATDYVSQPGL